MAPPKGAACGGTSVQNEFISTQVTSISAPAENATHTCTEKAKPLEDTQGEKPKKVSLKKIAWTNVGLKKPPLKRSPAQLKEMEVSVTISVGSADISIELLGKIEEFIEKECISGLCSIERGGALSKLHMQMVCWLLATSVAMVSKRIKVCLGWDDADRAPLGHHILTKVLWNTGLHTFIGMLGYCVKDKGEEHFQCVHRNVTQSQIDEGIEEYIKHGTSFAKNRIVLTHTNLIERAATYCRFKLKKQLGSTLPSTLLPLLRFGQYIPSASWVLLVRQSGMEYTRASTLWKCMINPDAVEMEDVTQIFFEHTNPGSRLADLGCQRLATDLGEAREGAEHDYVLPVDVPLEPQPEENEVIVIDGTQDAAHSNEHTAQTDAHGGLHTEDLPLYIPVVYGDRDIHTSLLL